jgi:hypothetical protein
MKEAIEFHLDGLIAGVLPIQWGKRLTLYRYFIFILSKTALFMSNVLLGI